jgi:transposase
VPRPFPKEFREDVVRVARASDSSVAQVAKDFGISESCLHRWLAQDDVEREMTHRRRVPRQWARIRDSAKGQAQR